MRKLLSSVSLLIASTVIIISCSKTKDVSPELISGDVLSKISALGFSSANVVKVEEGYIVEGDIVLTNEMLNSNPSQKYLVIANEEQYRTTNLVKGLPRVIKVSVDSRMGSTYVTATDEAIRRYNAENLQITFQRVASGADINIVRSGGNFLASAGFPTSGGQPYGQVKVNTSQLSGQPINTIASVLAHELGHCIGFRHTDYMNRSYSCGGSAVNEGASNVGAIHIPGTPTGPDSRSWMLSCIGSGQDRPFNNNDKSALNYLY